MEALNTLSLSLRTHSLTRKYATTWEKMGKATPYGRSSMSKGTERDFL